MRFWYSANAKKFFRCNLTNYTSGSSYYGAITDGNDFKATDGSTGKYVQTYDSTSGYGEGTKIAGYNAILFVKPFGVAHSNSTTATRYYLCLDNDTFDDAKYNASGSLDTATYTLSINSSYPGSTVITITNSGASSIVFNAIELITASTANTAGFYLANDNTNRGTIKPFLMNALILDEAVTVPAGGTYSITFTV